MSRRSHARAAPVGRLRRRRWPVGPRFWGCRFGAALLGAPRTPAIFQGNCFETDINDQSYNHITKKDIHVDCMDISWIDKRTISKIYFRGNELKDKVKEKNQLIRFTTMIIKPDKETFMTQIDNMDLIQRSDKVYQAIK